MGIFSSNNRLLESNVMKLNKQSETILKTLESHSGLKRKTILESIVKLCDFDNCTIDDAIQNLKEKLIRRFENE